jgi:hypothetical protein
VYFGRKHTAHVTLKQTLTFKCVHCMYTTDAEVVATGTGVGNSPFLLDNEGAANRASSDAEEDARNKLLDTIRFAHCPKCSLRNERAVGWARVRLIVLALVAGAAVVGGFRFYDLDRPHPLGLPIALAAAAVVMIAIYFAGRRRWEHADRRVGFAPVKKRAKQPATPSAPTPPPLPAEPFRSPPVATITAVETAKPLAAPAVVPGDPADKPKFLL